MKRNRLFIVLLLLVLVMISACSKQTKKEVKQTKNTKQRKIKDYDMPIPIKEDRAYEKETIQLMKGYLNILEQNNVTEPGDMVLSDKILNEIALEIAKCGAPVCLSNGNINMINYEKFEAFIETVLKKKDASITYYQVNPDGGFSRTHIESKSDRMIKTSVTTGWNGGLKPCIYMMHRCKVVDLKYTNKGWLFIKSAVPKVPEEASEEMPSTYMIRIKPIKKEYRDLCNQYIRPISYQGNNLFLIDWDHSNMKKIAFNDLFEYLYGIKNKKQFNANDQEGDIPAADFEKVILSFFDMDSNELKKYADYDPKKKEYSWVRFGFGNFEHDMDCNAEPEVVDIKENNDGSIDVTVDAVWEGASQDAAFTHVVTMKKSGGTYHFLKNKITDVKIEKMPDYRRREK